MATAAPTGWCYTNLVRSIQGITRERKPLLRPRETPYPHRLPVRFFPPDCTRPADNVGFAILPANFLYRAKLDDPHNITHELSRPTSKTAT